MGQPAIPTAADRAATQALAARIVQSVVNDEAMPLGMTPSDLGRQRPRLVYDKSEVEELIFKLSQEITLLRDAAEPLVRAFYLYNGYRLDSRHVSGCVMDALNILAPDAAAELRDGVDAHDIYQKHWGERE